MKEIEVLYKLEEGAEKPTQGYEDDFAYDLYASEGVLIPPLTFRSVTVKTNLKTAFDPIVAGMKLSLRSGAAANTPLLVSNSPGIIEGSYRDGLKILMRNSFIDNRLVDFAFDLKGNRVPLSRVASPIKKAARAFYDKETEMLGYDKSQKEIADKIFKSFVPAGTIYIAKGDRPAQIHFQDKVSAKFIRSDVFPDSVRGAKGIGSSGSSVKDKG